MDDLTNKYLLNIKSIDEQHRLFIELLEEELRSKNKLDSANLIDAINQLEDYVKSHFNTEELLLEKSGYSDLESHRAQHLFFIHKVDEMKMELTYNNPLLYDKLIEFMKKWFLAHILNTDKRYLATVNNYLQGGEI
jgi:hemerythrin-like metal-binding protein